MLSVKNGFVCFKHFGKRLIIDARKLKGAARGLPIAHFPGLPPKVVAMTIWQGALLPVFSINEKPVSAKEGVFLVVEHSTPFVLWVSSKVTWISEKNIHHQADQEWIDSLHNSYHVFDPIDSVLNTSEAA